MPTLCDICNARPASGRVTIVQNGQRKTIAICDYDYRQLMRHQNVLNPFDSLLGGMGGRDGLSGFFNNFTQGRSNDESTFGRCPASPLTPQKRLANSRSSFCRKQPKRPTR